jgi:hypothetical protein
MYREEIIGIFLAMVSIILTILGYHFNIEVMKFIFAFLSGVFTTYVIQFRLKTESEKRETIRKHKLTMKKTIYGPIFEELNLTLDTVQSPQSVGLESCDKIKKISKHYLFFKISRDLRSKLSEICDRIDKYERIHRATELMLQGIIRGEVEKQHKIDIDHNEFTPDIALLIGEVHVARISLRNSLLLDIEPQKFIEKETEKWGKSIQIEVSIGGKKGTLSDFELLRKSVELEAKKDLLYEEEKIQRGRLKSGLDEVLKKIEPFVSEE